MWKPQLYFNNTRLCYVFVLNVSTCWEEKVSEKDVNISVSDKLSTKWLSYDNK